MGLCFHGSHYWRTDKAGKRFRYCGICHAVDMPKKRKPLVAVEVTLMECPCCGKDVSVTEESPLNGWKTYRCVECNGMFSACPQCGSTSGNVAELPGRDPHCLDCYDPEWEERRRRR